MSDAERKELAVVIGVIVLTLSDYSVIATLLLLVSLTKYILTKRRER